MTNLMTIPPEIRLMILEHLLLSQNISEETRLPEVVPSTSPTDAHEDNMETEGRAPSGLNPQILVTCRQIYGEGIGLLYSKNTFLIREANMVCSNSDCDGFVAAKRFFGTIGRTNAGLLRKVAVGGDIKMIKVESLRECLQLANGLTEFKLYYLNIQAAFKTSSTTLTRVSSVIRNGFVHDDIGLIHLVFHSGGEHGIRAEIEVNMEETIAYFREKVHEQEGEWKKQGWNRKLHKALRARTQWVSC